MKFKQLLPALAAFIFLAAASQEVEQDLGFPELTVSRDVVSFPKEASEDTLSFVATRSWTVTSDSKWVAIDPDHGEPSQDPCTVTITVLDNSSYDREAKINVSIGFTVIPVTIAQSGKGSIDQLVIYRNDFDKEAAPSSSPYPYLDKSDVWKNQQGSGIANLKYHAAGTSVRNGSNSNGSYSDYDGSGLNNLFFGSGAAFGLLNLATNGATAFEFSFGTEKYDANDKTAPFDTLEMPVFVSIDGTKWAKASYKFAGTEAGRWNIASGSFSVPENTATFHVLFRPTKASCYRIDDLRIAIPNEEEGNVTHGPLLDFANGETIAATANIEPGASSGGSGEGGGDTPANAIFYHSFKDNGQGSFTVNDVTLPSQIAKIWTADSQYACMKATAYANSTNYASESWLISPEIDLTAETKACLEFMHAGNYFIDISADVSVHISKDGGVNWTKLNITTFPEGFDFVSSGKIDLSAYLGSKVKIGFKYTSTATKAGTWEIQSVSVLREEAGGSSGGGDTPTGESITISNIGTSLTWTATSDATYGSGYTATDATNGVEVSYFKASGSSNPVAPGASDAYIKVYKGSRLHIKFTDGRTITGVILTTSSATYTFTVKVGTANSSVDKTAKTITWSGSTTAFEAVSDGGQIRVQNIQLFY